MQALKHHFTPPLSEYFVLLVPSDQRLCSALTAQWTIPGGTRQAVDFAITFNMVHHQEIQPRPLLLVETKPPSKFHWDLGHGAAILQVIRHLDNIGPTNVFADWLLYAISAIGKRWWGCYAFRGQSSWCGQPVMGITARSSLRSHSLELYWNGNITSDTSWAALEGIAQIIGDYVNP